MEITISKIKKYIICLFFIFIAIFVSVYCLSDFIFDYISGYDRAYIEKMESVKVGMFEKDVIELLGKPDKIITDPEIKMTHGKYGIGEEYGKVIKNENKCFIYFHGVDYIGTYFIGKNRRVYFVNVGGT